MAKVSLSDTCDVAVIHLDAVRAAQKHLLSAEDAGELATVFGVLADPTRVRLLHALSLRELCVCDLANVLGIKQPAVSHQLRTLRALRVVRFRKEGQIAYYSLADSHIAHLLKQGLAHIRGLSDGVSAGNVA